MTNPELYERATERLVEILELLPTSVTTETKMSEPKLLRTWRGKPPRKDVANILCGLLRNRLSVAKLRGDLSAETADMIKAHIEQLIKKPNGDVLFKAGNISRAIAKATNASEREHFYFGARSVPYPSEHFELYAKPIKFSGLWAV